MLEDMLICNICNNTYNILLQNGFLSSLPFLAGWGSSILFANISHRITNRNIVSKTLNKKICNSIGMCLTNQPYILRIKKINATKKNNLNQS